jgi:uncharacterized membrane protein YqjE
MALRQWTFEAIEEGDASVWLLGLIVKGLAELLAAFVLSSILLVVVWFLFPLGAIVEVVGTTTRSALLLLLFLGIAREMTICTFTSSFNNSEEKTEHRSQQSEESEY